MLGGMILITGLGVTVWGVAELKFQIFPYTMRDWDYDLKAMLQYIDKIPKDAEYVKKFANAKFKFEDKQNKIKIIKEVEDIVDSFGYREDQVVKRLVYRSSYERINQSSVYDIIKELDKIGFEAKYNTDKNQREVGVNVVGVLYITLK